MIDMKSNNSENIRLFEILLKEENENDRVAHDQALQAGLSEEQLPSIGGQYQLKEIRINVDKIDSYWDSEGIDPFKYEEVEDISIGLVPERERIPYTNVFGTNTGFEEDGGLTLYNIAAEDIDRVKGVDRNEMRKELDELREQRPTVDEGEELSDDNGY